VPFNVEPPTRDLELWPLYDTIRCPTLVLRASTRTCSRATRRAHGAREARGRALSSFRGVGHAPTLIHADQIAVVRDFLLDAR